MEKDTFDENELVNLEIDGVLDLHAFSPKDIKTLIPEYLYQCHSLGILEIRIIHGKGLGNLRRSVHALLDRNPLVKGYKMAGLDSGSWGATLVSLKSQQLAEEKKEE
ncbi:MAG: DNA mismatch repair protein MutS [Desulfobulbaceae bacterium]|nr:MAG: DNA mismatch repair protein MutS [Desulfobulbaceae bacterium]